MSPALAGGCLGLVFAFFGVGLTVLTGNPLFDAIATIFIGVLLVAVAVIVGVEVKSLLVGEGASREDVAKIEAALVACQEIDRIIHMKTLYLGPDEILVGAKVSLPPTIQMRQVSTIVNLAERRIREAVPAVNVIYIEPDVWIDPNDPLPSTNSVVMLSSD